MTEICSWETPPESGKPFSLYLEGRRMIFFKDIEDVQLDEDGTFAGSKIEGWMPIHIDKNFPGGMPFMKPVNKD